MIPIARPMLGEEEIEAVVGVLRSGNLAQGQVVELFERQFAEYVGVRHAVAVSTGTAALHLALIAIGVGPGDEVITTPFTFIATANAVLYTGARPVFADVCDDTLNLNPDEVAARVTPRTKAILPVHLYGHPADVQSLLAIASRHSLGIVEDAAQAHGSSIGGRKVGSFGIGCFSFYATKNITTAEGGMITTDDSAVADHLRMLRSHGQRERYRHEILGYNYRMTDVQAAIGLAQMNRLEALTEKRIANAKRLSRGIHSVATPIVRAGHRHVFHQYTVRIPRARDEAIRLLGAAGVGTAIHYPIPVHLQKLYLDLGYEERLPVAEKAASEVLSLPVHPSLTDEELDTVRDAVNALPLG
jgi:perosamine synthetase